MKTVVRFLIVAGIVFTAVLLASSCDDDDKDDQTSIIGTWQVAETEASVERTATATQTETELEAALANYIKIPVNSRVSFSTTQLTVPVDINGGGAVQKTYDYTLNNGTLSIVLPISDPKALLGNADLKDNTLTVTLTSATYLKLLQYLGERDGNFKPVVDQISSATLYFRLNRVN